MQDKLRLADTHSHAYQTGRQVVSFVQLIHSNRSVFQEHNPLAEVTNG